MNRICQSRLRKMMQEIRASLVWSRKRCRQTMIRVNIKLLHALLSQFKYRLLDDVECQKSMTLLAFSMKSFFFYSLVCLILWSVLSRRFVIASTMVDDPQRISRVCLFFIFGLQYHDTFRYGWKIVEILCVSRYISLIEKAHSVISTIASKMS